jgi:hypothetical protein
MARNKIRNTITASTGGPGNPTKPKAVKDKVILCARVKAVTVPISLRVPLTSHRGN